MANVKQGNTRSLEQTERVGAYWQSTMCQRVWWWPQGTDTKVRLVDMTPSHRLNLAKWLMRNAEKIAKVALWGWLAMPYPNGDMAQMGFDDAMDEDMELAYNNPRKWMREMPLKRELDRLIRIDFRNSRPRSAVQILEVDF